MQNESKCDIIWSFIQYNGTIFVFFFLFLSIRSVSQSKYGDQSISSWMADLHQNLNRVFQSAGALTENFLEGIIIKELTHLPKWEE